LWDPVAIAEQAKSPSKNFCYGYQNIDTAGKYISTMKLEIGVDSTEHLLGHENLLKIASYDIAEATGTYIGQINMIAVSSFTGPGAAVWGYDLVTPDDLRKKCLFHIHEDPHDMFKLNPITPPKIPVYSVDPLLKASKALYGTADDRRYPILAGAHVPCAVKESYSFDPKTNKPAAGWLWSYISLAIAENRHTDACLFVEDCGFHPEEEFLIKSDQSETIKEKLEAKLKNVTYCQYLCGRNQKTPFKEIFAGYVFKHVTQYQIGCALICAPYVLLAQGAYPNQDAKNLKNMSLAEWEKCMFNSHK